MRELKAKCLAAIEAGRGAHTPRSVAGLAEEIQQDADRILSRLQATELRADALEESGKLDAPALEAFGRIVADMERALARVRQAQIALASRFPEQSLEEDPLSRQVREAVFGRAIIFEGRDD